MRPESSQQDPPEDAGKLPPSASTQGFLVDCMIDPDPNATSRAGRARGRAFGISALAQAGLLILMLILPLFATSNLTAVRNAIPIAPYGGIPRRGQETKPKDPVQPSSRKHHIVADGPIYPVPSNTKKRSDVSDENSRGDSNETPNFGLPTGDPNSNFTGIGAIPIPGIYDGPRPPISAIETKAPVKPIEVSQGAEMAQLIHKVDPVYPTIAAHNHIEGTVELRAIIGRDGTVRELQVLSGQAFLAFAAKEAVRQWRFRPTRLNGQPVEVDTFITVVFRFEK